MRSTGLLTGSRGGGMSHQDAQVITELRGAFA
jgi:hypothetical protein